LRLVHADGAGAPAHGGGDKECAGDAGHRTARSADRLDQVGRVLTVLDRPQQLTTMHLSSRGEGEALMLRQLIKGRLKVV
jgi:hypothetical protein